jgi:hypothetical protein
VLLHLFRGQAQFLSARAGITGAEDHAYRCHYSSDSTFSLTLESGGDLYLMVTPAMNGCSFGVGSPTNSGARTVAHSNVSRTANTSQCTQRRGIAQATNLTVAIKDPNPSIIGPTDYVRDKVFGTTVGVWNGNQWKFFMQVWKRPIPSSFVFDQIKDIA